MSNPFEHIDAILQQQKETLGDHYRRYLNHVYRSFYLAQLHHCGDLTQDQQIRLAIAISFRGLPDWVSSGGPAWETRGIPMIEYLADQQLLDLAGPIGQLLAPSPKRKEVFGKDEAMDELIRKAYWTDITKGAQLFGLPKSAYHRLLKKFPSRGFHWLMRIRTTDQSQTDSRIRVWAIRQATRIA